MTSRAIPIIQVDGLSVDSHYSPAPAPAAIGQKASMSLSPESHAPPLESSWSVQHMAVPVSPSDEFASTRSSMRDDASAADEPLEDFAVVKEAPAVHAAHLVGDDHDDKKGGDARHIVPHKANAAAPVRRLAGASEFQSAAEARRARRRRWVRVLLLVLCLCSWIAIGVLTLLAFVPFGGKTETELALLPWGLSLVPLGLFVLLCWPLCWPRTACERKSCGCIERLFGCSSRDGC